MMRSIFLRTLYDKRWFILGWSLAMSATAGLMVAMYPAFKEGMEEIIATMPAQFQGLAGDASSFGSMETYLASQLFDIRVPLLLMIAAAVMAVGLTVTPEEKGHLRTILSGRFSRTSLYIQTWYAALMMVIAIVASMALVTILSVLAIGDPVPWRTLLTLGIMTVAFIMMTFTIVYALGAATGSRMLTLGIGLMIIIASFILDIGAAVDWLDSVQVLSLLSYFDAAMVPADGVDIVDQLVVLSITLVSFVIGLVLFRRRDIG